MTAGLPLELAANPGLLQELAIPNLAPSVITAKL